MPAFTGSSAGACTRAGRRPDPGADDASRYLRSLHATHLAERDQLLGALVPQHQADAFDAVPQRQPADVAELGIFAQHARQTVIRNPAAQMMHMMNADIGGEPAQDAGQHIIRAAVQRGLVQIPVLVVGPHGVLELVLDVEQPHADRGRQQHDRQMHQQERSDADQPHQRGDDDRDRQVGAHGAEPRLPAAAHQSERQPVPQDEKIGRPDTEHHRRMAIQPIAQPAPARQRQIFAHRQGIDVADAAALQIARGRMMNGVRSPPEIIGRQGEHAERAAGPVIGEAMAEECAVAAVVLDHEQPHQEAGGRHGEQQAQPPEPKRIGQPHQRPQARQRTEGDAEFDDAARPGSARGSATGSASRRASLAAAVSSRPCVEPCRLFKLLSFKAMVAP